MDNNPNFAAGTRSESFAGLLASGSQNGAIPLSGLPESFFVPMPAVTRILSQFDREKLGAAIEVMIALLDLTDVDSDTEANGDELDGSLAEDDFQDQNADWNGLPGCPLSDPGEDDDSDYCTAADDRGTSWRGGAPGFAQRYGYDDDDEMRLQPVTLNPG